MASTPSRGSGKGELPQLEFDQCAGCGRLAHLMPKWPDDVDFCECGGEDEFLEARYAAFTAQEVEALLGATGPSPLNAMTDEEVANIGGAPPERYEAIQSARAKLRYLDQSSSSSSVSGSPDDR